MTRETTKLTTYLLYDLLHVTGGNAIAAALKVYELNAGKPKQYWAHSFTLVLLTGCKNSISRINFPFVLS